MATIINFNRIIKEQPEKQSGVIRKPGSKKLYIDIRYNGKRIQKSSGLDDTPENETKLQEWVEKQKLRILEGTFRFAEAFPNASESEKEYHSKWEGWEYKPEPNFILFKDYVIDWRKRFLDTCQSETKKRDHQQIIDDWLLPYFGEKMFNQISGVTIKEFITKQLIHRTGKKKGTPLSASRINNILIPFRTIWEDACEEYHWQIPDPFTYLKKYKPKRKTKAPEVFRFNEWNDVLKNFNPYYRPVAEVMIMTGMIGSEIAGLRKCDIYDDHIHITNSIVRNIEKTDLKTEYRKRKIPITHAIRKHLDRAIGQSQGEYIFTMKSGRNFDVDSFRKNAWTTALRKANVPYRVPYTTRHSFAAWSLTLRMDPNRLVNLMGHGSKKMIYEVYGRYVEGLETDAGKIFEYFGKDFNGLLQNNTLTFT